VGVLAGLRLGGLAASREAVHMLAVFVIGVVLLSVVAGYFYMNYVRAGEEGVLGGRGVVVALFWSETCPHCLHILPYWRQLEAKQPLSGKGVRFADVPLQSAEGPALFHKYGVFEMPTIVVLRDGRLVAELPGVTADSASELLAKVERLLEESQALAVPAQPGGRASGGGVAGLVSLPVLFAIGVATAFSPCALPVLLAYAASGRRLNPFLCGLAGFVGAGVLALVVALAAGFVVRALVFLPLLLSALLFYAGVLSLLGVEAGASLGRFSSMPGCLMCAVYPVLAAQCSLPVLLAGFAGVAAAASPLAALAFAAGLAVPLGLAAKGSSALNRFLERRGLGRVSGLLLIAAAVVIAVVYLVGV